jgi:uncharacterized coiled-coil protein SlyX
MDLANISTIKQQDKERFSLSESTALLLEKDQAIDELNRVVDSKSEVISKQKKHIAVLEEMIRLSKIKRFAPSSEQSQQTSLFDEAENEANSDGDDALDSALACDDEDPIEDE